MHIIFVCTGNTCRSPMAEVIARQEILKSQYMGISVTSAGIGAMSGDMASMGAQLAVSRQGLDLLHHRAKRLTPQMASEADLLLTMTAAQAQAIQHMVPEANVVPLAQYANGMCDIADPFGGSDEEYIACESQLRPLVKRALKLAAEQQRNK